MSQSQRIAQIIAVGPDAQEAGALATLLVEEAGVVVSDRHEVAADGVAPVVSRAILSGQTELVLVIGSRPGLTRSLLALLDDRLPVMVAAYSWRRHQALGAAALGDAVVFGRASGALVALLPDDAAAVRCGIAEVILPALGLAGGDPVADMDSPLAATADTPPPVKAPPPATVARGGLSLGASEVGTDSAPPAADPTPGELPRPGWLRAIHDLGGEILRDRREELPNDLAAISPVVDVLHTAGETAVWKRGKVKFSLWGWPDLRRPTSRVIAIGWGLPVGEVIALHRHPSATGLCIEEARGVVYGRGSDVASVAETITGRPPKDCSGALFATQGDTVWIQRGARVYRWDGRREVDDGTPTQVISSLVLHWSNR